MKCPVCPESMLVMSDRQGVEIDYCPQCRGVWLDRGELDKLIERAAETAPSAVPERPRDFKDTDYGRRSHSHQGRKKSWLSDIFD
jgi:Zn-finger nucleic acid-binding protein